MHLIPTVSASAPPVTGPRRLLYAMIEDLFALRDLKLITPVRRQHMRDEEWLASDQEEPFTFLWVCQHLDISPLVLRQRYRQGETLAGRVESKHRGDSALLRAQRGKFGCD